MDIAPENKKLSGRTGTVLTAVLPDNLLNQFQSKVRRVTLTDVTFPVAASEEQILAACRQALRLAPSEYPPTLPSSKELSGVPDWYPFEHEAWRIGESIRRAFADDPLLKRKEIVVSKVAEVAQCRELRRGRQSFIMVLGFVAACSHAEAIVPLLRDPDVDGQVLDALLKMRAPGFTREVTFLLDSDQPWKRDLAKKYVDRYSVVSPVGVPQLEQN